MAYQPGDFILGKKYHIEQEIGRGAFAQVYRAMHLELRVPRALKLLDRQASGAGSTVIRDFHERFQLEAHLGARLNHPNLIHVHDYDHQGEDLVLVMEYAPGGSLGDRLAAGQPAGQPFAIPEALQMLLEISDGLAALHQQDIVHRDLKPSNILFDGQRRAKISDLGLAQVPHGPSLRSQLSQGAAHPGTPGYMSPEQEKTFDYLAPSSDIYALGVIAFLLLTGRMYKGVRPGTHPNTLRPEIPAWLDGLLLRMLDKDPEQRPWDGAELADLLRGGMGAGGREAAQAAAQQAEDEQRLAQQRLAQEEEALRKLRQQAKEEEQRLQALRAEQQRLEDERREREAIQPRQAAAKQQNELSISLAPGVEMAFVRVPAGEFWMGSNPEKDELAKNDEQPQHKVHLDEYWIGKYPVANRQYRAFVQASRRPAPGHWEAGSIPAGKEDHPVVNVSWQDAAEFCRWAAKASGQRLRLATEAEWEKAARGADGRIYPWGNEAPDAARCNFNSNVGDTTPVGDYSPQGDSPYACADMAGNVWEWVNDWYDGPYYQKSPPRSPAGPPSGEYRVLRGGAWDDDWVSVRSAYRVFLDPTDMGYFDGFRCARSA
jgi:formylglycine-generating enzyme required for sulfatase activity